MLYFIVNPNAGTGRGLRVWNTAKKFLQKHREPYEVYFTAQPGDARKKARELTESCRQQRVLITVGGDGTINEVADGICLNCPVILGVLPAGSANDLGKSLRLPRGGKLLKHILLSQSSSCMDYGVLSFGAGERENRRFLVSSGIGLDAAVCHELLDSRLKDQMNRLHFGPLSYLAVGLRKLMLTKPTRGYLVLDGTKRVEFNHIVFISVHIHPYEGGGFRFAPMADPTDGKLAVCVVSSPGRLRLVPLFLRARRRALKSCPGVRFYECKEAHIHTERPLCVHTDGESCALQTDIDVRCVERQLRVLH